jgi:hypothetical protein
MFPSSATSNSSSSSNSASNLILRAAAIYSAAVTEEKNSNTELERFLQEEAPKQKAAIDAKLAQVRETIAATEAKARQAILTTINEILQDATPPTITAIRLDNLQAMPLKPKDLASFINTQIQTEEKKLDSKEEEKQQSIKNAAEQKLTELNKSIMEKKALLTAQRILSDLPNQTNNEDKKTIETLERDLENLKKQQQETIQSRDQAQTLLEQITKNSSDQKQRQDKIKRAIEAAQKLCETIQPGLDSCRQQQTASVLEEWKAFTTKRITMTRDYLVAKGNLRMAARNSQLAEATQSVVRNFSQEQATNLLWQTTQNLIEGKNLPEWKNSRTTESKPSLYMAIAIALISNIRTTTTRRRESAIIHLVNSIKSSHQNAALLKNLHEYVITSDEVTKSADYFYELLARAADEAKNDDEYESIGKKNQQQLEKVQRVQDISVIDGFEKAMAEDAKKRSEATVEQLSPELRLLKTLSRKIKQELIKTLQKNNYNIHAPACAIFKLLCEESGIDVMAIPDTENNDDNQFYLLQAFHPELLSLTEAKSEVKAVTSASSASVSSSESKKEEKKEETKATISNNATSINNHLESILQQQIVAIPIFSSPNQGYQTKYIDGSTTSRRNAIFLAQGQATQKRAEQKQDLDNLQKFAQAILSSQADLKEFDINENINNQLLEILKILVRANFKTVKKYIISALIYDKYELIDATSHTANSINRSQRKTQIKEQSIFITLLHQLSVRGGTNTDFKNNLTNFINAILKLCNKETIRTLIEDSLAMGYTEVAGQLLNTLRSIKSNNQITTTTSAPLTNTSSLSSSTTNSSSSSAVSSSIREKKLTTTNNTANGKDPLIPLEHLDDLYTILCPSTLSTKEKAAQEKEIVKKYLMQRTTLQEVSTAINYSLVIRMNVNCLTNSTSTTETKKTSEECKSYQSAIQIKIGEKSAVLAQLEFIQKINNIEDEKKEDLLTLDLTGFMDSKATGLYEIHNKIKTAFSSKNHPFLNLFPVMISELQREIATLKETLAETSTQLGYCIHEAEEALQETATANTQLQESLQVLKQRAKIFYALSSAPQRNQNALIEILDEKKENSLLVAYKQYTSNLDAKTPAACFNVQREILTSLLALNLKQLNVFLCHELDLLTQSPQAANHFNAMAKQLALLLGQDESKASGAKLLLDSLEEHYRTIRDKNTFKQKLDLYLQIIRNLEIIQNKPKEISDFLYLTLLKAIPQTQIPIYADKVYLLRNKLLLVENKNNPVNNSGNYTTIFNKCFDGNINTFLDFIQGYNRDIQERAQHLINITVERKDIASVVQRAQENLDLEQRAILAFYNFINPPSLNRIEHRNQFPYLFNPPSRFIEQELNKFFDISPSAALLQSIETTLQAREEATTMTLKMLQAFFQQLNTTMPTMSQFQTANMFALPLSASSSLSSSTLSTTDANNNTQPILPSSASRNLSVTDYS